jgi:hypothetical protein
MISREAKGVHFGGICRHLKSKNIVRNRTVISSYLRDLKNEGSITDTKTQRTNDKETRSQVTVNERNFYTLTDPLGRSRLWNLELKKLADKAENPTAESVTRKLQDWKDDAANETKVHSMIQNLWMSLINELGTELTINQLSRLALDLWKHLPFPNAPKLKSLKRIFDYWLSRKFVISVSYGYELSPAFRRKHTKHIDSGDEMLSYLSYAQLNEIKPGA